MIPPPYFSATLPVIVAQPGAYLTRCGERVTVTAVSGRYASGTYANGVKECWHKSGRLFPITDSDNDIISREGGT